MKTRFGTAVMLAGVLTGCAGAPPVDLEAQRASLMEADRAWSETVGDAEAFAAVFEPDGRMMPPEGQVATGPQAIQETAQQLFSTEGLTLSWKADSADVSADASLGYTTGTFEIAVPGPDGNPIARTGVYTTVWRKQADGSWNVTVDCAGYDSPPPAPEPEEPDQSQ